MAENKKAPVTANVTLREFTERLRGILPADYRTLTPENVLRVAVSAHPGLSDVRFKPEPEEDPGFFNALTQGLKEFAYRAPETAAGAFASIQSTLEDFDNKVLGRDRNNVEYRRNIYANARKYSQELVSEDPALLQYQRWAAENPFEWGKFISSPSMMGRVMSSVVGSMGTIMTAGALGSAMGGPGGGMAAGFGAGYMLEGGEAYAEAHERAINAGYTPEQVDEIANDSAFWYGMGAGILEGIVPLGVVTKFFGPTKSAMARFAGKYLDKSIKAGGKGGERVARETIKEMADSNLAFLKRLGDIGKATGIGQLKEASTELSQYLLQKAIIDGKVDKASIDPSWLVASIATPEAQESIAGGLLGGGVTITTGIRDALGTEGKKIADYLEAGDFTQEQRDKIIDEAINSRKMSFQDKVNLVNQVTEEDTRKAVESLKETVNTQTKEKTEKKVDKAIGATVAVTTEAGKIYDEQERQAAEARKAKSEMAESIASVGREAQEKERQRGILEDALYEEEEVDARRQKREDLLERKARIQDRLAQVKEEKAREEQDKRFQSLYKAGEKHRKVIDDPEASYLSKVKAKATLAGILVKLEDGWGKRRKVYSGEDFKSLSPEQQLLRKQELMDQEFFSITGEYVDDIIYEDPEIKKKAASIDNISNQPNFQDSRRYKTLANSIKLREAKLRKAIYERAGIDFVVGAIASPLKAKAPASNIGKKPEQVATKAIPKTVVKPATKKSAPDGDGYDKAVAHLSGKSTVTIRGIQAATGLGFSEASDLLKRLINEGRVVAKKDSRGVVVAYGVTKADSKRPSITTENVKKKQEGLAAAAARRAFEEKAKKEEAAEDVEAEKPPRIAEEPEIGDGEPSPKEQGIYEAPDKDFLSSQLDPGKLSGHKNIVDGTPAQKVTDFAIKFPREFAEQLKSLGKSEKKTVYDFIADSIEESFKSGRSKSNPGVRDSNGNPLISKIDGLLKRYRALNIRYVESVESGGVVGSKSKFILGIVNAQPQAPAKPKVKASPTQSSKNRLTIPPNVAKVAKELGLTIKSVVGLSDSRPSVYKGSSLPIKELRGSIFKLIRDLENRTGKRVVVAVAKNGKVKNPETGNTINFNGLHVAGGTPTIVISEEIYNNAANRDGAQKVFLHELVHALTVDALESDSDFKSSITSLMNEARSVATKEDLANEHISYGLLNEREFVSQALTSGNFARFLSSIKTDKSASGKNIFKRFLDAVAKALSIDGGGTLLEKTLIVVSSKITPEKQPKKRTQHSKKAPAKQADKKVDPPGGVTAEPHSSEKIDLGGFYPSITGFNPFVDMDSFSVDFSAPVEGEIKLEDDDRDGTAQGRFESLLEELYDDNPGVLIERYFMKEFGAYLTVETFAKLYEHARKNKDINMLTGREFEVYKGEALKIVSDSLGGKLPETDDVRAQNKVIKSFHQRANSTAFVDWSRLSGDGTMRWRDAIFLTADRWGSVTSIGTRVIQPNEEGDIVDPASGKVLPTREAQNFLEQDQAEGGVANKLIYASAKNIYQKIVTKKSQLGYFYKVADNIRIDSDLIKMLDRKFSQNYEQGKSRFLQFFFAETSGDNSQLIFSVVNPQVATTYLNSKDRSGVFKSYLLSEIAKGNMTKDQANDFISYGNKNYKSNPMVWAQLHSYIEKWKSIKGRTWLTRKTLGGKSVANLWKRLKIDVAHGTTPRGIGGSSIMTVDLGDGGNWEFSVNGKVIPHKRPDGKGYAFDGMIMTSKGFMDKMNIALGNSGYVYKTFIRDLGYETPNENGEYDDYIGIKGLEMTPPNGLTVKKDGEVVAKYNGKSWVDNAGQEFDRFATLDEVKDHSGRYSNLGTVQFLPERATKVKKVNDKDVRTGAFPILGFELMLDNNFFSENPAALDVYKAVLAHYQETGKAYSDKLYSFKYDPDGFSSYVRRDLQNGELPSEIQRALEINPKLLYLKGFASRVVNMLNNSFIRDGINKGRSFKRGVSTYLAIKPAMEIGLADDEIALSGNERIIFRMALSESGISPKGKSASKTIEELNNWLKKNDFWVLVHRTPIQEFTKVVPRKVKKFTHDQSHGKVAFLNPKDVFEIHEADHDGDFVFIEKLQNQDLMNSIIDLHQSGAIAKIDKRIDLDMFLPGTLGKKVSSMDDVMGYLDSNARVKGVQGFVVNGKTALSQNHFRGLKLEVESPNGKSKTFVAVDPSSEVTIDYFPLSKNLTKEQLAMIEADGDKIVNGRLVTTKRHEFSILLQAAVDNDKFGLFDHITSRGTSVGDFIISRLFEAEDGSGLSTEDIQLLRKVYSVMGTNRLKQGRTDGGRDLSFDESINESANLYEIFFDEDGKLLPGKEVGENFYRKYRMVVDQIQSKKYKGNLERLSSLGVNGQITPTEYLLSRLGIETLENIVENHEIGIIDPIRVSRDRYNYVHEVAISELQAEINGELTQAVKDGKRSAVEQGQKLGRDMASEFYEVFAKVEQDRAKRSAARNDDELFLSLDYSKEFEDFSSKWYPVFKKAKQGKDGDIVSKFSTMTFLSGAVRDGKIVRNVGQLLHLHLMDEGILSRYADKYYAHLYTSPINELTPDLKAQNQYKSMMKDLEKLEGKLCG